jgi:hypothetical protein
MESFFAGTSLFFSNLLLLLFRQLSTTTQWTSILGTLNPTLLDVYILYAVLTLSLQDTQVAVHNGSLLVVGRVEMTKNRHIEPDSRLHPGQLETTMSTHRHLCICF